MHRSQIQNITKLGCQFPRVAYLPNNIRCPPNGHLNFCWGAEDVTCISPKQQGKLKFTFKCSSTEKQLGPACIAQRTWQPEQKNTSSVCLGTASNLGGWAWAARGATELTRRRSFRHLLTSEERELNTVTFPPTKPHLFMCLYGDL